MEQNDTLVKQIDHLFNPHAVAVIGASNNLTNWGFGILNRLLNSSVQRRVYPVNTKLTDLRGMKVYASITEIPESVDFAVIAIPAAEVPQVMQECVQKGVKGALIISAGFAEVDEKGARLEEEVVRIARQGGIRFIGPNCMGHFNTSADLSTLAIIGQVRKGPISFISQSGTFGTHMIRNGLETGVGFTKFVGSGNEADLHLEDYLEYLAQDEETKVITAYIEGLREGKRFFQMAKGITRKKPIVVLKVGKTQSGEKAAHSHTAALAGSDTVFDSMCKQSGIIRVADDDELFDTTAALLHLPLPPGRGVGILTEGGGIGVLAADTCEEAGLKVAYISPDNIEKLNTILPSRWSHGNPVDTVAALFVTFPCLFTMIEDENIDSIMCISGVASVTNYAMMSTPPAWAKAMVDQFVAQHEEDEVKNLEKIFGLMRELQKPIVFSTLLTEAIKNSKAYKKLHENGMLMYPTPQRAAKVLANTAWYNNYLRSLSERGEKN